MEDPPDPTECCQQDTADVEEGEQSNLAPANELSQDQLNDSNVEKSATILSDLNECVDGDCTEAQKNDEAAPEDDQPEDEENTPAIEGGANADQADGPIESPQEECLVLNKANCGDQQEPANKNLAEEESKQVIQEISMKEPRPKVETIGPASQETSHMTGHKKGIANLLCIGVVALIAILVSLVLPQEPPPPNTTALAVNVFLKQLETVQARFPHQRPELWNRSRRHLTRHLETFRPTEPVSLILTAGVGSRRTLHCLARDLGTAISTALNGSVLEIEGAGRAGEDSNAVKEDIDEQLQGAFRGDKPVAVIHRLEQLPPGSTLIFYRYCDHENAAYKTTSLIFTVLLEEEAIPAKISLNAVEEMVDDHLQSKFLSHGRPLAYDRMDLDKYSGLWSRISHLILPVAAEATMEHKGCL
ncbi:torsin-1A-interacting protein 2-like [Stigmatopora nigra]